MRALLVLVALCGTAIARPPPPPEEIADSGSWRDHPARIEWSTWVRLAYGWAEPRAAAVAARTTEPTTAPDDGASRWDAGVGIEASLVVGRHSRLGAWAELRGTQGFGGAELVLTGAPASLDMFLYKGEGVLALRGGIGPDDQITGAIAYGYRCPWNLFGSASRGTRYEIGARVVLTMTRSPEEWSSTLGIEFEPVGALRYLLGIRSWY
ncbi:MAG: hypothetical protein JNL83_29590 [Myxococcales bacterium]|nr:hypothetical protein [Myxococcales bacterium]